MPLAHLFALLILIPAIEHIADHLTNTCIGVIHIIDMYASGIQNKVSLIAGRDNP